MDRVLEMSENPDTSEAMFFSLQGCAVPSGARERIRGVQEVAPVT